MSTHGTLDDVEHWFRSRGTPHFIADCSASRAVFTPAVPALTVVLISAMIGVFFVGFGLLTITPATAASWSGTDIHLRAEGEVRGGRWS